MAWLPAEEDEDSVESSGRELTDQNQIIQLLKMIRSQPEGRQFLRDVKSRGNQMMTPIEETPESLGREYKQRFDFGPKLNDMKIPEDFIQNKSRMLTPPHEKTPEELGKEMTQQNSIFQLLNGSGQQHARAYQPNPGLERQIQAEAQGLMEDERNASNSWHPPMSNPGVQGWHPPMSSSAMPNTPRDPDKEERQRQAMKAFLANGGGPSYSRVNKDPMSSIIPGQNPFKDKPATPEEQAQVAGGVMFNQLPANRPVQDVQATPEQSFERPEGFPDNPMTADIREPALNPQPSPATPPSPAAPQAPNPLRDRLLAALEAQQSPNGQMEERMRARNLENRMNAISNQNADLGFMKLLMRNANQMGTLGGKSASSAPFDDQVGEMQARNTQAEDRFIKNDQRTKSMKDQRLQTMLALLKMDQDAALRREGFDVQRENNSAMRDYRQDMLDATAGRDNNALSLGNRRIDADIEAKNAALGHQSSALAETTRHNQSMENIAAERAKAEAARARKSGANLDPVQKKMLEGLSSKTATAMDSLSNFDSFLKAFDSAGSESEKINYALANLKTLQSLEGPDAINGTDAERLTGYLNPVRPKELFRSGGSVFGMEIPKFRADIQRRVDQIKQRIRSNQRQIDQIKKTGGMTDTTDLSSGERKIVRKQHNKNLNKTRITYSDGSSEELDGIL